MLKAQQSTEMERLLMAWILLQNFDVQVSRFVDLISFLMADCRYQQMMKWIGNIHETLSQLFIDASPLDHTTCRMAL
ncbi:hypothetical protein BAL199_02074 [alpha proteobacterium BAL199]|jgi:hypothetical protein|nr:hypothetical protein BAL199_02074 [alpha proteobacterium BAL199]